MFLGQECRGYFSRSINCSPCLFQTLLPAANILQMTEVRDACCEFLQSQLHPSNALGIKAFADLHACTELFNYANTYCEQHFT
jgi:kelch-like protein 2/3